MILPPSVGSEGPRADHGKLGEAAAALTYAAEEPGVRTVLSISDDSFGSGVTAHRVRMCLVQTAKSTNWPLSDDPSQCV